MVAFTKPGLTLIEREFVPVRRASAVGRIDVIDGNIIFTLYRLMPADGDDEAVMSDRIEFPIGVIPDEIQFTLSVLARVGMRMVIRKPLVLQ